MDFLSPLVIAVAAGLTIPPLVALYFLKLKRMVRLVPSTLLWKKSVEDLHVNSPFQRLRGSLLLLLQLLVLIAAAIALGKPMLQTAERHESTVIILIDQSASMGVLEADGRSRLEKAKEQAKLRVDNMDEDARAMVIAFCDRATVVSSFDTDRHALKRKIDSVEQTESTSTLGEAMSLAEAYTQNIIIGSEEAGADRPPDSVAPPASVFVFTDGRVQDADHVALQKFDIDKIHMINVGARADNVGIIAMDARRNYERPEILEVAATVENFGNEAVAVDAVLYVDGQNVDVQAVQLTAAEDDADAERTQPSGNSVGSALGVVAFDEIEFEGGGVAEVVLRVNDALPTDDRAWTIIEKPRHIRLLLVTPGNWFLENVLATLPLELVVMEPREYEGADDQILREGERSAFDIVMLDRHSTARLPQGNYFFWGAAPQIEGVAAGRVIDDQVIFNWDDTHPILRHVAVETLFVYEWLELRLPPEAVAVVDGETTPVMSHLARNASQYLISAFSLIAEDDLGNPMMNTYWATTVDFVVFMQNAVQYLAGSAATVGKKSVLPGEPVTVPIPSRTREAEVRRPDGTSDAVPVAGYDTMHYARTRRVGTYHVDPAAQGSEAFAVNLFNPVESRVAPVMTLVLGADLVEAQAGSIRVNQPAWPYLVLAMLILILLEWVVYNHRVFV